METNLTLQMSTANWITDKRTGNQYLVLDIHDLVYDHLQQVCQDHGGFLPEPKDEQENQFLDSLNTDMFTLGMTDRKVEGQWIWESDGSPVSWANWVTWSSGVVEPNGGRRQNCAMVLQQTEGHAGGHRADGWSDYPCQSTPYIRRLRRHLICQRNPGMWKIAI